MMSSRSVLLFTVVLMGYFYWSLAQPKNPIKVRCMVKPEVNNSAMCPHGTFLNACGKWDCIKGPGENCGTNIPDIILYGKCADGLWCCNGQCKGCTKGNCFNEACHPSKRHSYQPRSDPDMLARYIDRLYSIYDY
ncbi:neuroparsin-A-like [Anopheles nili]|uniref:neuroparsin-A-like n=1 Tax=Anopheles nili TaxID=185578 RepID=UPI00237B5C32|nr:neuroparsin-A-like [Anopheles nili]